MIKFLRKLLGVGKRKSKPIAKKPKPQKNVVVAREIIDLAVSETVPVARAEREAALMRYKDLNIAVLNKLLDDAINNAHSTARSRSYDAAKHAATAGKSRSDVLQAGKLTARLTYRAAIDAAIDRAIDAYIADLRACQHEGSAKSTETPKKGLDINREVSLSLREAYKGVKKRITLNGREVVVDIPRGAASGTVVKVNGAGNNGINRGPRGDLVVTIRMIEDEVFERKGDHIYCKTGILVKPGDTVELPTLVGPRTVTIPETLCSGNWLRFVGYGMPKTGSTSAYGDLYYRSVEFSLDPHGSYLTEEGYANLRAEEKRLEELLAELSKATGQTQSRESKVKKNAEFHDLQERQSIVIGKLNQIRSVVQTAQVVNQSGLISNYVVVGSTVVLREEGRDEEEEYQIVGAAESNPRQGKISLKSPIGAAVIGHKKSSVVRVKTPDGTTQFTIVDIKMN